MTLLFSCYFMFIWLCWFNRTDVSSIIKNEDDLEKMIKSLNKTTLDHFIKKRWIITIVSSISFLFLLYDKQYVQFQSILVGIIAYKIQYYLLLKKYNKELTIAKDLFPYYLNNLSILIQNNPVPNALLKSIEVAPTIFKADLQQLVQDIHEGRKKGITPYLHFASRFKQIDDLTRIMRTCYHLSATSENKQIMLTSLTKIANEKVNYARKQKCEAYLDGQALYPWLGFLWVGFVCIASLSTINISSIG